MDKPLNTPCKIQSQDTKKRDLIRLLEILYIKPMSRRMAATELGYTDQTYMVTQNILDLIAQGRAAIVGSIKCTRSNEFVQAVTSDPELFPKSNQCKMDFGDDA